MKRIFLRFGFISLLIPLWIFLRNIYRDRIPAFGCFDDCFNYMGGYFLLAGKHLYSQVFFNHQPIPAYLSAAIQFVTKPDGIYMLIYQHRMFMIYFSMIFDALLIMRFGFAGFGFAVLYESTKGYLFGEHFLAEAMIVYPLVYLLGIIGEIWGKKKIYFFDFIAVGVITWFITFSREPYVPLAIVLFGYLFWKTRKIIWSKVSLVLFFVLSIATIAIHSLPDYFFNIITVNVGRPGSEGNILQIIFYPVLIFFGGTWNVFRYIEMSLAILFWILIFWNIKRKSLGIESIPHLVWIFSILALANVRPTFPGEIYYAAFHHLVWYALFIMTILILMRQTKGMFSKIAGIAFLGIAAWALLSPQSYLYEKVDRQVEFMTNFDRIFVVGGIVKTLSAPADTLFLDGWDDLIYFQAQRYSPYKYSWYTSSMWQFERFAKAREDMFVKSSPDFYYGKCAKDAIESFPKRAEYVQLKPACVFVLRSKLSEIPDAKWDAAKQFDIMKPIYAPAL